MCLGVLVGLWFGPQLSFLGLVSQFLVSAIKAVALPLVFFAILDGFLKSEFRGLGFFWMGIISGFNALCAITIALTISNIFEPGKWLSLGGLGQKDSIQSETWFLELSKRLSGSELKSLMTGTTLMILLSLSLGLLLILMKKCLPSKHREWITMISEGTSKSLQILFWIIDRLVLFLPVAVFCAVVKAIGLHGLSIGKGLLAYFLACSGGMLLHILIVYQIWIRWVGVIGISYFWKIAIVPALYAFGINSSLASLPVTLKALEKLQVTPASARLSSCVGTNFNNDGILLYEVVAALFIIQSYQIHLPLLSQTLIALISIIACLGVSGIPEAGIISLTIVLSSVGIPTEVIPVLLTVDWILARMRSFTNVLGDITVGVVVDRLTSQGRFSKKPQLLR